MDNDNGKRQIHTRALRVSPSAGSTRRVTTAIAFIFLIVASGWCSHESVAFGESVVAHLWLCVLCNSLVDRALYLGIANVCISELDIRVETELCLQLSEHSAIGSTLIVNLWPGPWLL